MTVVSMTHYEFPAAAKTAGDFVAGFAESGLQHHRMAAVARNGGNAKESTSQWV